MVGGWPVGYLQGVEELNLRPLKTDPSSGREEDLNLGPPDYKFSTLPLGHARLPKIPVTSVPQTSLSGTDNAISNSNCFPLDVHSQWFNNSQLFELPSDILNNLPFRLNTVVQWYILQNLNKMSWKSSQFSVDWKSD